MRNLFVVLAKLLGVLLLYLSIDTAHEVIDRAFMLKAVASENWPPQWLVYFFVPVSKLVIGLLLACMMLVRTQWLARVLRIPDGEITGEGEYQALLGVGIKLIGLYVAADVLPDVIRRTMVVWEQSRNELTSVSVEASSSLWAAVVTLLVGLFLLLQAKVLVGWLSQKKSVDGVSASDGQDQA